MKEIWRPINNFDNYEISSLSRVRNCLTGKILKPFKNVQGYLKVCLYYKPMKKKLLSVHRVVMEAFVGPSALQVNHKNSNRSDARLENLEYVTAKENIIHGFKYRTRDSHHRTKISEKQLAQLFRLKIRGVKRKVLAEKYNVNIHYIDILTKELRK